MKRVPSWLVLLFGILLGASLTYTVTFHLWWCTALVSNTQENLGMLRGRSSFPFTQAIASPDGGKTERCVCGTELEALESAKVMPSDPDTSVKDSSADEEVTTPQTSKLSGNCSKTESVSVGVKLSLVASVVSSRGRPEWLETVFDTWGQDAAQLVMFVGDWNFNKTDSRLRGLPVVAVPPSVPSGKGVLLPALRFLIKNRLDGNSWFLLAQDDTYVRIRELEGLLGQLDPSQPHYVGRWATGRNTEAPKLGLKPHERYCLGSSGVVLSSGLVYRLQEVLENCWDAAGDIPDDVILGKCISRHLDIQCSQDEMVKNYFVEDYSGHAVTPAYLRTSASFGPALTYHPVPEVTGLWLLHQHYRLVRFSKARDEVFSTHQTLLDECMSPDTVKIPGLVCAPPAVCHCDSKSPFSKCPKAGVVQTPPTPYQPTTIYDYQSWVYFDATTMYPDSSMHPSFRLRLKKDFRHELKQALTLIMQKASEQYGRQLKFKKLVNGWFRHNPFVGNEYIVDAIFLDGSMKTISKRVSLVRPLATNHITRKDSADSTTVINMVVPLTKVTSRFSEFMTMYEKLVLVRNEKVRLILSVYGRQDYEHVSAVMKPLETKYPQAKLTVLEGQGAFSRGKALHSGIMHVPSNEIMFVCDVDMKIEPAFFERCRKNTIQSKRVYYPEFFKLYNMDYVYFQEKHPKQLALKRQHGHWAYYSFGMLCMFKSDYTVVGGMDTAVQGWGDEDVQFFQKVIRRRLEVLRAPDPALSHRWHEKHCPRTLKESQHKHCLSSQRENLADRQELASYIYKVGVNLKASREAGLADLSSNATAEQEEEDYGTD